MSSNKFLPSPLESFVPFVSKSFRNDWQIRICQLSKCLVDFRGRPFDFWGGYRWFQKKKYPTDWFQGGKACKDIAGKIISCTEKNIAHDVYNAEKKIVHRYMSGKKFLTPEVWKKNRSQTNSSIPLPLQKSNGQPHKGWGKKRIWNFSNWHPSTKWLAHVHHGVV